MRQCRQGHVVAELQWDAVVEVAIVTNDRGPEEMEAVAAAMAAVRPDGLLLVAQSNAGLPVLVGDRFEYTAGPEVMAEHALRLRALGVDLVGACCGSTPAKPM